MKNNIYHFLINPLVAALITACNGSGLPDSNSPTGKNGQALHSSSIAAQDQPCDTVSVSQIVSDKNTLSKTDQTIAHFQKAVSQALEPQHAMERLGWAFVAKARETRDVGYYKLAEQVAECIDRTIPDTPEALLLRGHVLHNLHHFNEAETVARRLTAQRGNWFDFALLGDVLMERGALSEAVEAYQAAIDQRPGPQVYLRVAQLRWLKGDLDDALEMTAVAVRSISPRTPEPAAWANVKLAGLLLQVNELRAAEKVLDHALALQVNYPPALHMKGRLLLVQNRINDAIPLLKAAVQADSLPEFRWTLYEAYRVAGNNTAAAEQRLKLLQRGEIDDRRTFALFLATEGDSPDTALRLAQQELLLRQDVFTLDAVAWALSAAGKYQQALDTVKRALAVGTHDGRLYFHAGVIAARANDPSLALSLLNKAIAIEQMLLPSERQQLAEEFEALQPQMSTLVTGTSPRQQPLIF